MTKNFSKLFSMLDKIKFIVWFVQSDVVLHNCIFLSDIFFF